MSKYLIRYTVRADEASTNLAMLRDYFDALDAVRPPDLVYEAYLMEDGLTFVHIVDSATGAEPFARLPAYRRYRGTLLERCSVSPKMVALENIGAYSSTPE